MMTTKERQIVRDILSNMAERGKLTPDAVVKEATKKESPLHSYFLWDDKRAAHEFRKEQARELIRGCYLVVTVEEKIIKVPEFVRNPMKATDEAGYVAIEKLRESPEQAKKHLEAELNNVLAVFRRAEGYALLLGLGSELDIARSAVRSLSAKLAPEATQ